MFSLLIDQVTGCHKRQRVRQELYKVEGGSETITIKLSGKWRRLRKCILTQLLDVTLRNMTWGDVKGPYCKLLSYSSCRWLSPSFVDLLFVGPYLFPGWCTPDSFCLYHDSKAKVFQGLKTVANSWLGGAGFTSVYGQSPRRQDRARSCILIQNFTRQKPARQNQTKPKTLHCT